MSVRGSEFKLRVQALPLSKGFWGMLCFVSSSEWLRVGEFFAGVSCLALGRDPHVGLRDA